MHVSSHNAQFILWDPIYEFTKTIMLPFNLIGNFLTKFSIEL